MVTAIIVNFHTAAFLPRLINQLLSESSVGKIVVVDNSGEVSSGGSVPSSARLLVIKNRENIGFGAAANQALEHAEGEWVLVINPDVRLMDNCLDKLLETGKTYNSPLVGPRFYWDDRCLFRLPPATGSCLWLDFGNSCAEKYRLDAELVSFYWTFRHERFWQSREPFFEPFLQGACLLINRDWIVSRGGKIFDDVFFLYFEDTDLCVRALLEGVRPLCVPDAYVIHYYDQSPASSVSKSRLMANSRSIFFKKHYPGIPSPIPDSPRFSAQAVDMGELLTPPVFVAEKGINWEGYFFEIGVNSYFVPFAQSIITGNRFEFPADVWRGLSPGTYYGRVRASIPGTLNVWQWQKL